MQAQSTPPPCVQPVYALTAQAPAQPSAPALIDQTVTDANTWLAGKTGVQLRICGATITVRLPLRPSGIARLGPKTWAAIDRDTPHQPGVIDAVFLSEQGIRMGGISGQPSQTALISTGWTDPRAILFQRDSFLHEIFHTLGVGHVYDNPCDLMAPASQPCAGGPTLGAYMPAVEASPYVESAV